MLIDNITSIFCEKYDREAIESIERISKEIGLIEHGLTIPAFNIEAAFENFTSYLSDYVSFLEKSTIVGSHEHELMQKTNRDEITKSFTKYVDTKVFDESAYTYDQLPSFVSSFFNGINTLTEKVDMLKEDMLDHNINGDLIGDINEYTDIFVQKLTEKMDPVMEKILWASGYNSAKKLFTEKSPKQSAVFV